MLSDTTFQEHIRTSNWYEPGLKILVACSGGVDSIVLLHLFRKIPELKLSVVHFDHQLRGSASDEDRDFVMQIADTLGYSMHILTEDISKYAELNGLSIEEAGSNRRRSGFEQLRQDLGFDLVATGQHLDDQVETILLNLYQGSGIKGLSGIGEIADRIIRPLLIFSRADIVRYADQNQISYRTDESNTDVSYLRNNIRTEVLPILDPQKEKQLKAVVQRLSQAGKSLDGFILETVESVDIKEFSDDFAPKLALGLTNLPDYFSPIQKAIFDRAFQLISLKPQGLSEEHFKGLKSLLPEKAIGKEYQIPASITAVRDRSGIVMFNRSHLVWSDKQGMIDGARFPFFTIDSTLDSIKDHLKDPNYFWPEKELTAYILRPFRSGDRIVVDVSGRTIAVGQIMQAAKLAPHLKAHFPVMEVNNEIVWIPGIRTAYSALISEATIKENNMKHCIKVQFQKGTFE